MGNYLPILHKFIIYNNIYFVFYSFIDNYNNKMSNKLNESRITFSGRSMTEDIVISGISGRFPESDSMDELKYNLYNGLDMITEDERRWPLGLYGLPTRSGKMKDLGKFDAQFFGVNGKQANKMDPQLRLLLEVTYEAIVDSGIYLFIIQFKL